MAFSSGIFDLPNGQKAVMNGLEDLPSAERQRIADVLQRDDFQEFLEETQREQQREESRE